MSLGKQNDNMRRSFALLLYIALLTIAFGAIAALFGWRANIQNNWVQRTLLVLYKESDLLSAVQDINLSSKGYALTNRKNFLEELDKAKESQRRLVEELSAITIANAKQQRTIAELKPALQKLVDESKRVRESGDAESVIAQKTAMDSVRNIMNDVFSDAQHSLQMRQDDDTILKHLFWGALVVQLIGEFVLIIAVGNSLRQYEKDNQEKLKQLQKAKDEAIAAREVAERALETKSRFLATVSHEVRTPMAGVIGLTEILSLQDLGEENNSAVKGVLESSTSLLQILNNVLETARLESGKVSLERKNFPVRALIGDIRQLIRPDASAKELTVAGSCDNAIPEYVCGDEMRIRQILLNLSFNAVKFTDSGSIEIGASLKEMTAQRTVIRFTVSDTGIGIGASDQRTIFQPFEQIIDTTKRVKGGAGLGLAITKELVELMGGQIGVESEPGKGSTFWFEIPFMAETAQP